MNNHFLFVDPGNSTGWATFTEIGIPTGRGIARGIDKFADWMSEQEPFAVVGYEDWHLFGHKAMAQTGSKMEASQAIGIIKLKAKDWGSTVISFRPGIYRVGMQYAGQRVPKSHIADDLSAYYMGIYHLTMEKIITSQGRHVLSKEDLLNRRTK